MLRFATLVTALFVSLAHGQGEVPSLRQIMDDPSWFARSPEGGRWLFDGSGVLFEQRRDGVLGRETRDRFLLLLDGRTPAGEPREVGDFERRRLLAASQVISRDRRRMLIEDSGDIFLVEDGDLRQLTRTSASESSPIFMTNPDHIAYRRGGDWFVRDLASGLESQAADVRFAEDPDGREPRGRSDMEQHQFDLFLFLREREERRELRETIQHARQRLDPMSVPGPFYLDPKRRERGQWLSPSGRALLMATGPRDSRNDPTDIMPDYVTDSGNVTTSRLRPKVGQQTREPVGFVLLDLDRLVAHDLPLDDLPGIREDPLARIKAAAEARRKGESLDPEAVAETTEGKARGVGLMGARWSDSGNHAAVMLRSNDNKDRWILALDATQREPAWTVIHHMRDEAWIGTRFNRFGFVPGSETVWFESEHSGWSHLYLCEVDGQQRALTDGDWEVRDTTPSSDGLSFLVRTNRTDRGVYEVERVTTDGVLTPITSMGGTVESFRVSPDEDRLLLTWSDLMDPPELFAVSADGAGEPTPLTNTVTDLYRSFDFVEPELVWVPSTHTEGSIYTRVYLPDAARFPGPRPVVIFAHGAGYLQFAYRGWSNYFREHMFHTLLTERGFIVLGPDFRHSEGYGRNWRTAVYRDMGEPELQDFDDCLAFAAAHYNADPDRVGIYGGSYGGFLTLMGLFLRPDVYDAGAALRSVTDWRQYSHSWTSNILDTPQIDPEPFDRSSPINHAEHFRGALLMCHGLVDDNVVAQDVIRLAQRLIELEKENWELALYPAEPHGFREPTGWLDEYRRILKLFETQLLDASER